MKQQIPDRTRSFPSPPKTRCNHARTFQQACLLEMR
jgi:hypothetical protein